MWECLFFGDVVAGKKCMAYLVCHEMNIPKDNWAFCKDVIRESIRIRRANCNAALKKEYHGKFSLVLAWEGVT
jgi:hypothetical protein